MAKLKIETKVKRLEKQIEQARTIFLCLGFIGTEMPETMKDEIQKFLKASSE